MHIVFSLQPGGMEFGVVKLVNGLNPLRVQSAICSTRPSGALKHLVSPGIPIFDLNRREGNDIRIVWELHRLFRRERPDVVHTHGWGTLLEGILAARLAGVPSVVHGEHGTLQVKPHQRWLQRRAWLSADRVLSVSSRLAERMAAEMKLSVARITTIRNGVDLSRFNPGHRAAARVVLGLPDEALVLGTVGRLVPVKDHATLLEAVALLKRDGVDATLVVSGDGPLREAFLARAAALGIQNQVRLLGYRKDVEVVLAALDVFVLSSVSEGLSNTILEAMATGLPVVATRVGGADELVRDGETGLLVAPGSPHGMAAALGQLAADRRRRPAMGAAGRVRAETEFALSTMVQRYEALYVKLAALKSGGTVANQPEGGERSQFMRREYR
jgi:sugar transferase (PEP-CTERM/EpsH1 system associated)